MECKFAPDKKKKAVNSKPLTHKEFNCPRWHNFQDRRRVVANAMGQYYYKTTVCKENIKKACPLEDQCDFSHNHFETSFHPARYKKDKC